jgi:hypothetical protein
MHGGKSTGPKTKGGKMRSRLAALRNGRYTQKAKAEHKEVMTLIRQAKDVLSSLT